MHLIKRGFSFVCLFIFFRTLLITYLSFLGCLGPSLLVMVFDPMPPCNSYPKLHVAAYIIFWTSGFVNPLIYMLSNRNYREAHLNFIKNLKCLSSSHQPHYDSSTQESNTATTKSKEKYRENQGTLSLNSDTGAETPIYENLRRPLNGPLRNTQVTEI